MNPHFVPNKSGYHLLVSRGVEIVQNDSLRGSLSLLYETLYPYYYRYEEERTQFKLNEINSALMKYFQWHSNPDLPYFGLYKISMEDYSTIRDDTDFSRLLYAVEFENALVQDRAQRVERAIESLINEIENELESK